VPKTVAILQSNYVPWKGYFDLVRAVDEFILYDEVQYTRRDWRNRNRFKSPAGVRWLTIPVQAKGRYFQRIDETLISDPDWAVKHWSTLRAWYAKAPYFEHYRPVLEEAYLGIKDENLSRINRYLLEVLMELLGIDTPITWSTAYDGTGSKTDRLLSLCQAAGATCYLSGPAARAYLEEDLFQAQGIDVSWMSYEGYPTYDQIHPPFDHHVSVLDLLFNVGDEASLYMLGRS
jgi:WbqC-like protein family